MIDEVWPLEYQTDCGEGGENVNSLHPYLVKIMVDYGCFGVMDTRTGKMIIPAIYSDINMISQNLLMAEIDGNEENNIIFTTAGIVLRQ